jgi:hypothetical protein
VSFQDCCLRSIHRLKKTVTRKNNQKKFSMLGQTGNIEPRTYLSSFSRTCGRNLKSDQKSFEGRDPACKIRFHVYFETDESLSGLSPRGGALKRTRRGTRIGNVSSFYLMASDDRSKHDMKSFLRWSFRNGQLPDVQPM